jgi:ferritin-like metal-binding protein YciE
LLLVLDVCSLLGHEPPSRTAKTLADQLGYDRAEELLGGTLDEEAVADKLLTKIATGGFLRSGINDRAAG